VRLLSAILLAILALGAFSADAMISGTIVPGTTYYVSSTASGSGNGTSGSPWNFAQVDVGPTGGYQANTLIQLAAGTYSSSAGISIGLDQWSTLNPPTPNAPLIIDGGGATISTVSGDSCVKMSNIGGFIIRNMTCTGSGNADGIEAINSLAGNISLPGFTIIGTTVSGYAYACIHVSGTSGYSGYNGINIVDNTVHGCTTSSTPVPTNNAGILVESFGVAFANLPSPIKAFQNVYIAGNNSYGNTGAAGQTSQTGSGILVSEGYNVLMDENIADDNGALSNSSGGNASGIWSLDSTNTTMQRNESYNNLTGGNGDGDGFDCDSFSVNCIIQFNYSHDNQGNGILSYSGSGVSDTNVIIRYNITQNNGWSNNECEVTLNTLGSTQGIQVYNNTFWHGTQAGSATSDAAICALGSGSLGATINNNIFANTLNHDMIYAPNSVGVVMNYNDYFTPQFAYGQAMSFYWNSTTYTTLASFASASSQETNGLTSDPLLNAPGNAAGFNSPDSLGGIGYSPSALAPYQLITGSPMLGTGTTISSPGPHDYYGNPIATPPNIGAYSATATSPTQVRIVNFCGFFNSTQSATAACTLTPKAAGDALAVVMYYCTNSSCSAATSGYSVSGITGATCSSVVANASNASYIPSALWVCPNITTGSKTLTATITGTPAPYTFSIIVYELSGVPTSSITEQPNTASGTLSGTSTMTIQPAGTLSQAGELVLGEIFANGSCYPAQPSIVPSADTGSTGTGSCAANYVTTTAVGQQPTLTTYNSTTSGPYSGVVAGFKHS
jgi:hypothetical protein